MSAAFASKSGRFSMRNEMGMMGPRPGDYNPDANDSMAAEARKRATPRGASFGGSGSRDLPWQKLPEDVPRGASPSARRSSTPRSEELARVPSTFGSSTSARPSSAFSGGGDRFASNKMATPGPGAYSERVPLSPSKRVNRSASFNSKSKRFGKMEQSEGPGPGAFEALPSSFASASQRRSGASGGFGSKSARASPFEPKSQGEEGNPGYQYNLPGAFSSRGTESKASGNSSFASKSSRFGRAAEGQGADVGSYDSASFHSMARSAGKSFNKKSENGANGFGTSARRPEQMPGGRGAYADSPGPAAYAEIAAPFGKKVDARPSSAFASKSKKEGYVRQTDSPTGADVYHADSHDSMAASSNRSFNRKLGSASFGARATREMYKGETPTPGPGAYASEASGRRTSGGWAAQTTPRASDPTGWARAAAF